MVRVFFTKHWHHLLLTELFIFTGTDKNWHFVIDCTQRVMKEHCYWPLVSDFNNVLSHESVALVFLRDNDLIEMWFEFLSMLQGKFIVAHFLQFES